MLTLPIARSWYAIPAAKCPLLHANHSDQRLIRTVRLWSTLQHPNVLPFLGFYVSQTWDQAWLISPYQERNNVIEYIRETQPDDVERFRLVSHSTVFVSGQS